MSKIDVHGQAETFHKYIFWESSNDTAVFFHIFTYAVNISKVNS